MMKLSGNPTLISMIDIQEYELFNTDAGLITRCTSTSSSASSAWLLHLLTLIHPSSSSSRCALSTCCIMWAVMFYGNLRQSPD